MNNELQAEFHINLTAARFLLQLSCTNNEVTAWLVPEFIRLEITPCACLFFTGNQKGLEVKHWNNNEHLVKLLYCLLPSMNCCIMEKRWTSALMDGIYMPISTYRPKSICASQKHLQCMSLPISNMNKKNKTLHSLYYYNNNSV